MKVPNKGATDLRRIRVDPDGLITQDKKGRMKRISLTASEAAFFKDDAQKGLRRLSGRYDYLNDFFDGKSVNATVDIIDEKVDFLNRPLRIYYGIEPRCNLSCGFCGPRDLHDSFKPASPEMENFIIGEIARSGAFQIQLTGGEIGIRGCDLLDTLERVRRAGLAVILATNGVWSCIDRKDKFLKELARYRNIIQTKISIEGSRTFHERVRGRGTYAETVDTLKELARHNLKPRISATIFKSSCNRQELNHLAALARKYRAGLQPIPLRPVGNASALREEIPSPENLRKYAIWATGLRKKMGIDLTFNFDVFEKGRQVPVYDLHSPVSCGAPLWGVHITHTGEVYPCGFAQEAGKGKAFLAGRIVSKGDLTDIWLNSKVLKRIRQSGKPARCDSCADYGKGCWGGCWVNAWIRTGRVNGMDPYCVKSY